MQVKSVFNLITFMKHIKRLLVLISIPFLIFTGCKTKDINTEFEWTSSSPNALWNTKNTAIAFTTKNKSVDYISIYPNQEEQKIDGFGACFNELGWEAITSLPEHSQNEIFESLFNPETGCNFTINRMPIGANDYAINWYSHNETDDDFKMLDFSISRDKKRLIPYIKKAKTYNSNLKLWASPWCPPSWMKKNKHYACNPAPENDLKESGKGVEMETQFIMQQKYLQAYALYFSKFIESYKQEGIDIYSVHVQNEPNSCQSFPSCVWHPRDLATFIGDYLGPQFEAQKLDTDIWLGTIERPNIERIDSVLTHSKAKQYIKGVGFQWAGKGAIPKVNKKYPSLKLMQTETECGNGSNDWAAAEKTYGLIKHYFNNGANSYLYWNMVLNETGKSQWGWKQNSMISVDTKTNSFVFNPEFYLMKHFSQFVKPGARKIKTTDDNCLAFKNEESIIIVYYNESNTESTKSFEINNTFFSMTFNAKSFNTLKINN